MRFSTELWSNYESPGSVKFSLCGFMFESSRQTVKSVKYPLMKKALNENEECSKEVDAELTAGAASSRRLSASASRCAASRTPTWPCLQPKHSQCLQPVVPVRPVLPSHSALWNTCLCPSVPRVWVVFFFFPHSECCLRSFTKSLIQIRRSDRLFSEILSCVCFVSTHSISSAAPYCRRRRRCCTVRRSTGLKVDHKLISFSVSHPTTAAEQQSRRG